MNRPSPLAEQELASVLADVMRDADVPGAVAAIASTEGQIHAAYGVTSSLTGARVTTNTLFQLGSITKPILAVGLMRLVEQGRLALDRPVRHWLPELKLADAQASNVVTAEHLLTHTSGIFGDSVVDTGKDEDALARYIVHVNELPQVVAPGTAYSYCNTGFAILGRLIEVITDQPVDVALRELVCAPLGMSGVYFGAEQVITREFAVGHTRYEGTLAISRPWMLPRGLWSIGGGIMRVQDLVQLGRHLWTDSTSTAISRESIVRMTTGHADAVGDATAADEIGLGWKLTKHLNAPVVSHTGAMYGQRAVLMTLPDSGVSFAAMANADHSASALHRVAREMLRRVSGIDLTEPPVKTTRIHPWLVGTYRSSLSTLAVRTEGDEDWIDLTPHPWGREFPPAEPAPPARLGAVADDELRVLDGPTAGARARIVRTDSGAVRFLRVEGRICLPL